MGFERSDDMPRQMDSVYDWAVQFKFSRPTKNIARDFSDAVLLAEILAQLVPAWIQLHNYPSAHRFQQKLNNWETLNRKVLTRLKCGISPKHQEDIANAVPGAIELLLIQVKRATANSPFLQAKRAASSQYDASRIHPSSPAFSANSSPPSTPSSSSSTMSKPTAISRVGGHEYEDDSVTTSFSKLLQMMSDTSEEFEDVMEDSPPRVQSRANTAPPIQLNTQTRGATTRPLTPNYAKPTKSTIAMARPGSVDAKPRWLSQAAPFVFPRKKEQEATSIHPEKLEEACLEVDENHLSSNTNDFHERLVDEKHLSSVTIEFQEQSENEKHLPSDSNELQEESVDEKHLPSDTNEFQEGSFVYFLSSEALPMALSMGDPEDQAQVARVIKTLPSGECALQLFRRISSSSSPQRNPNVKTTRCYFATPHFIDCCSTLLHTIPAMEFDLHTNTCEWHIRFTKMKLNDSNKARRKPAQNGSPQPERYFFTEVLTRVRFTSASLAQPITQTIESESPTVRLRCPRFAESFRVPVEPTVFPKVLVDLVVELPGRFPSHTRQM